MLRSCSTASARHWSPEDALAAAARAYLALSAFSLVASLAGAPAALVPVLALAQGALKLALAAAVVAPALGRVRESVAAWAGLHALRAGSAVGLLWLAGFGVAPGHAVDPRPVAEVVAPAAAGHVDAPPAVAALVTDPPAAPCRAAGGRPCRPRRSALAPAGLV